MPTIEQDQRGQHHDDDDHTGDLDLGVVVDDGQRGTEHQRGDSQDEGDTLGRPFPLRQKTAEVADHDQVTWSGQTTALSGPICRQPQTKTARS